MKQVTIYNPAGPVTITFTGERPVKTCETCQQVIPPSGAFQLQAEYEASAKAIADVLWNSVSGGLVLALQAEINRRYQK